MFKKGFTLIELIVVSAIVGFILLSFTAMAFFFSRQVNFSKERTNAWSQLEYTINDMRIRCVSAVNTTTPLDPGGNITINSTTGDSFSFEGEGDIYDITPDNLSDNVIYAYAVLPSTHPDNPESLVLNTTRAAGTTSNILIDGKYSPEVRIDHNCPGAGDCDEPHFVTVTIEMLEPVGNVTISRSEGIRFWFLDVVQ